MKDEHFIKVYCSQELPRKDGKYVTEYGNTYYRTDSTIKWKFDSIIVQPTWWLKPIDLDQIKAQVWEEGKGAGIQIEFEQENGIESNVTNPYNNNNYGSKRT